MIFSSILFLTKFLPLFLIGYFLLPKQRTIKNIFILASSFLFYAWGEPRFVFVLFFTTILDFFLVRKMDSYEDRFKRRLFLSFPILLNVGLLCYFKYFNFFLDNANSIAGLLHISLGHVDRIILPIGISFYTFESLTYSVDVYRRVHKPLDRFWEYQMYIILFPKLIAGPIVRYHEIADQIKDHINRDNFSNRLHGFIRFGIGLSKKVLIANVVGAQADAVFALDPARLNTMIAWVGALAYTLQIYFDFSGYSDMAIGISRMLGFRLPENFNNPYTSKSITEFWKRWHITLGKWMRNYLYIPLGGNKVSKEKTLRNLFIVFVLSGLWHGAGWNFIIWGMYYGLFLVIERITFRDIEPKGIWAFIGWLYTFLVVVTGWMLFRIEDIHKAFHYILKMFSFDFAHNYVFIYKPDFLAVFLIGVFFSFCTFNQKIRVFSERLFEGSLEKNHVLVFSLSGMVFFMICLVSLSGGSFNPFIYFKF